MQKKIRKAAAHINGPAGSLPLSNATNNHTLATRRLPPSGRDPKQACLYLAHDMLWSSLLSSQICLMRSHPTATRDGRQASAYFLRRQTPTRYVLNLDAHSHATRTIPTWYHT